MDSGPGLFIVLVILIGLSAFFSASETALTSLSKIRLRNMVEENVKRADIISRLVENPKKLLSAILVGNNLVNICASSIATMIAMSIDPVYGVGVSTVLMTIVVLICGEITPKTLAAQNSEKISLLVAKTISFVVFILTPIIAVLNVVTGFIIRFLGGDSSKQGPAITEAELKTMVNVSHEEGVLEKDERQMINNVFDFGDAKAKDVMTPRTDMIAIPMDVTFQEVSQIFNEERFSRLPVYKDSLDDIVGILHLKDVAFLTEDNFSIEELMREAYFTYESKSTSLLFAEMRTNRIPVAIILDEYGGTSGLVTIEDLVEEIVGDISDEYDEDDEEIEVVKEDEFIVDGSTKIDDVNEMIGTKIESEDFDSIGGYVIGILGRFPDAGEKIETEEGVRFIVEEIDKNRIEKLRIFT